MKLKYYLRGLGIGMAVTALILGIASAVTPDRAMTDEEILNRAKELGLVERTVLSETVRQDEETEGQPAKSETAEPQSQESEAVEPESSEPETDAPQPSESEEEEPSEPEEEESSEPAEEEPSEPEPENQIPDEPDSDPAVTEGMADGRETVSVEIVRGDSSVSVSKKLKEAGLIEDDLLYDRFLCENGYDKRIQAKVYEIPIDATESEIAEMISGKTGIR